MFVKSETNLVIDQVAERFFLLLHLLLSFHDVTVLEKEKQLKFFSNENKNEYIVSPVAKYDIGA
jgi:hypothetical protein